MRLPIKMEKYARFTFGGMEYVDPWDLEPGDMYAVVRVGPDTERSGLHEGGEWQLKLKLKLSPLMLCTGEPTQDKYGKPLIPSIEVKL